MYGPGYEPQPIEKIRKAQWTVENTAKTQGVVNDLERCCQGVILVLGRSSTKDAMEAAMRRFKFLDPGVILPRRLCE